MDRSEESQKKKKKTLWRKRGKRSGLLSREGKITHLNRRPGRGHLIRVPDRCKGRRRKERERS